MRRGQSTLGQFFGLLSSVPRDLARLVRDARRGNMRVDLDLKRLDTFGRKLDAAIDRITVGIMTASLVIGSSIVMTVQAGRPLAAAVHRARMIGNRRVLQQRLDYRLDLALEPGLTPRILPTNYGRGGPCAKSRSMPCSPLTTRASRS
jgi:hypothetical protein